MPKDQTIVGIVGYRDYHDFNFVEDEILCWELDNRDIDIVVSGGANGVDKLAEKFAEKYNIKKVVYPANWEKYGSPMAAKIRNSQIVDNIDYLIAFPSRKSRGTFDTINKISKLIFDQNTSFFNRLELRLRSVHLDSLTYPYTALNDTNNANFVAEIIYYKKINDTLVNFYRLISDTDNSTVTLSVLSGTDYLEGEYNGTMYSYNAPFNPKLDHPAIDGGIYDTLSNVSGEFKAYITRN